MVEHKIPGSLRTAILNQRMYPTGSPIVERALAQLYEALMEGLKGEESLTLTNLGGKLMMKGKELPESNGLVPFLEDHNIKSLSFMPGFTLAEAAKLVALLGRKKISAEDLAEWARQEQINNIKFDKVTIMEVMEGEMVIKRMDQLLEQVNDFPALVGSLREAYDMMDKIPDDQSRAEAQEHLAQKLTDLEPSLLRDMFENELPPRLEESGLRSAVLNNMTQDKIHDIFSEIANWYRQVRSQTANEFEVVDQLNKLKSFLNKILTAPASNKVPFALFEELMSQGLLDDIPPGVERTSPEVSLAARVDKFLSQPAAALLEAPTRDELPSVMKKLCAVGLDDLSEKLLDKFAENFGQGTTLVRQTAVKTARSLFDILAANHNQRLCQKMSAALEQEAESERQADIYRETLQTLLQVVRHEILNNNTPEAVRLLGILRRHRHDDNPLTPKRPELASEALQGFARSVMDVLQQDVLSADKTKRENALSILNQIGEDAVPFHILTIKKSDDVRLRHLAAAQLKTAGPSATKQLAAELHLGNSTDTLLNVLSVLDDFLSAELVPQFERFLHFPESMVRRRMAQMLSRLPTPEAADLLVKFLDDPDEATQIDAIHAVGESKNNKAVPPLLLLAKTGSTRRREEACLALGQIASPQAVPLLSGLLESKSGLFKKKQDVEETVRVRAAWALAQIHSDEARKTLARLADDHNKQVQNIAKDALG